MESPKHKVNIFTFEFQTELNWSQQFRMHQNECNHFDGLSHSKYFLYLKMKTAFEKKNFFRDKNTLFLKKYP